MINIKFGEYFHKPMVVCLGFFDCMHTGHRKLLEKAKEQTVKTGALTAIFTFEDNHFSRLKKDTKLLYTFEERLRIYESLGADVVISAVFDENFMKKSGEEFLSELCDYEILGAVFGYDYTCGGDKLSAEKTAQVLLKKGVPCQTVEPIEYDGAKISSTLIRRLVSENDIARANSFLSEPYFITGVVVCGRSVGRTMGFPTANISVDRDKLLPEGVFSAITNVDGVEYRALVSIGPRPTFDINSASVEAHLIGFDGNLYGHMLKISLLRFLRPIVKFQNEEALKKQIELNLEIVKND